MLIKKIESALNEQIHVEALSSYHYLAIASWCDVQGMEGSAAFFYKQSEQERNHMLRLFRYINETGGFAITPQLEQPKLKYKDILEVIKSFFESETHVSKEVDKLVRITTEAKDYTTLNFLQWYVSEQHEEVTLARLLQDKIKLIGLEANGLYLIDREIGRYANEEINTANISK